MKDTFNSKIRIVFDNPNRPKNTCPVCEAPLGDADFLLSMAQMPTSKKNAKISVCAFCHSCGSSLGGSFTIPGKVLETKLSVGRWK
jgi:hypothetical protein